MEGINEGEVTGAIGVVSESAMDGLPNVRRGRRQEKRLALSITAENHGRSGSHDTKERSVNRALFRE